jgi:protein-S-isoprenylcysteine O-methyltransferase Ste14
MNLPLNFEEWSLRMAMIEEFTQSGNWLFRWRSYLPVILLVIVMSAMFFHRHLLSGNAWLWSISCLLISAIGELIRIYVVGHSADNTSGRNTKEQIADTVNTTGAYSLMRHPLYFANFLMWIGLGLFTRMWWINILFCLGYWIYYERIMFAEESFLRDKFGDAYLEYSKKTPPFFPLYLSRWQSPKLNFRWKKAIRQEISSFYALIFSFTILTVYRNFLILHKFFLSRTWMIFFISGTVIYLILRFLKKQTRTLQD